MITIILSVLGFAIWEGDRVWILAGGPGLLGYCFRNFGLMFWDGDFRLARLVTHFGPGFGKGAKRRFFLIWIGFL